METLTKAEIAHEILASLFKTQNRITIEAAVNAGAKRDVSRRTLRRIASELGVVEVHNGPYPAFWELPK